MIANKLLSKIPKNIVLNQDPLIKRIGVRHALMTNLIGVTFAAMFAVTFIAGFPITFSKPMLETRVLPDYGSGKTYTVYRRRERYYESI